jgi:acyl carrier protein
VLQVDAASLDVHRPLQSVGLDSLMTLELKNVVEEELAVSLPMTSLIEAECIADLSDVLLDAITEAEQGPEEEAPEASPAPVAVGATG